MRRLRATRPTHDGSETGGPGRVPQALIDFQGVRYHLAVIDSGSISLEKAEECLAGAESEFVSGRFNNCANRCYYAVFQAAIHALSLAQVAPPGPDADWGHEFVRSHFVGQLVNRRKQNSASLRTVPGTNCALRQSADYKREHVTEVRASRALQRTRQFLAAVRQEDARK